MNKTNGNAMRFVGGVLICNLGAMLKYMQLPYPNTTGINANDGNRNDYSTTTPVNDHENDHMLYNHKCILLRDMGEFTPRLDLTNTYAIGFAQPTSVELVSILTWFLEFASLNIGG